MLPNMVSDNNSLFTEKGIAISNNKDKNCSTELNSLIKEANSAFSKGFKNICWFGRCIFISWYCDVGSCKFCYRSTQKARIRHAKHAKRSLASIMLEAIFSKIFNWRIEFLTGGYRIYPIEELAAIARLVSKAYGKKIWLNLGALKKEELKLFLPYIKGVVASIETINSKLHKDVCPDKNIEDYEKMLGYAEELGLKKSITIIVGLGETKADFEKLTSFIKKHKLQRITFYALKPVPGTPYKRGPDTSYYAWWIAKTRAAFPELEIIAGTTYNRIKEINEENTSKEAYWLMKAGANAITKFPITKKFGSREAKKLKSNIEEAGRELISELIELPYIDIEKEIKKLDIDDALFDEELKKEITEKAVFYIDRMKKSIS